MTYQVNDILKGQFEGCFYQVIKTMGKKSMIVKRLQIERTDETHIKPIKNKFVEGAKEWKGRLNQYGYIKLDMDHCQKWSGNPQYSF